MAFMESPQFPNDIAMGVNFGPEFVTTLSANAAGYEVRNKLRTRALSRGDCAQAVKNQAQLSTLLTFFRSVGGRWAGFRFKDWSDYQLAAANSVFTLVGGTVNQFQTNKLYQSAVSFSEQRALRKPVVGTYAIYDGATLLVVGAGAGNYSLDTTTGIVSLVALQTRAISSHTVGATHTFTLSSALAPQPTVGQVVSVAGVTGSAAALLNNLPLVTTAVSGTSITVSINTTALTAAGGTLSLYSQAANLTASCEFDVPCRFDTDVMQTRVDNFGIYSWSQILIQELRV